MTRHVTRMSIWEAEHFSEDRRAAIVSAYPPHERDARAKGVPQLGSGRVFPVAEANVAIPAFNLPDWWPSLGALDFGWDHPTAAVKIAWDRDNDCAYVVNVYRVREATPLLHAAALKAWGQHLPWAWPHDGYQHDIESGRAIADAYRELGLKMLPHHAQFDGERGAGLEAGLMDMLERLQTGRLKVFDHLNDWFDEFRLYHRKDGVVVKEYDDLMSATRYALMSLRFARTAAVRPRAGYAEMDYDYFGGRDN